jgi:hypothetical protein
MVWKSKTTCLSAGRSFSDKNLLLLVNLQVQKHVGNKRRYPD